MLERDDTKMKRKALYVWRILAIVLVNVLLITMAARSEGSLSLFSSQEEPAVEALSKVGSTCLLYTSRCV